MFKKIFLLYLLILFVIGCSSNNETKVTEDEIKSPEEIYIIANTYFNNKNYELAILEFDRLKKLYPLSNEAIKAELNLGFISYLKLDYDDAILKFERMISKYPSHKDLDYIYYMRAMCNYEQITHHGLDGNFNDLALKNFNEVISRFPNSKYAKDSVQKIVLVKSNQAAKHLEIGRFYLKEKKYTAALNRFKIIVEDYSMTKFTPEALHRMVEAYYEMGMFEESYNTTAVLGHNYPQSKWYEFSYNLVKKIDNEKSFLEKVNKFFN